MKKLKTYIISILLLLIVSCAKTPKDRVLTMKNVFPTQKNTDSTIVFDLDTVKSYESLTSVFCKSYDNKKIRHFIKTNNNDILFSIRSSIICGNVACGLIKYRNILFVDYYTDSMFFHNRIKYNFNIIQFQKLLKNQFLNNGKGYEFADSPKRCLILLEFSGNINKSKISLNNKIDTISKAYFNFIKNFKNKNIDSIKSIYALQIILNKTIEILDEKGNRINFPPIPSIPLEIIN